MTVQAPHDGPLEEQRDALLARIHTSREAYRQQMHAVELKAAEPAAHALLRDTQTHPFPRSQTMRWLLGHPLIIAGGVAAGTGHRSAARREWRGKGRTASQWRCRPAHHDLAGPGKDAGRRPRDRRVGKHGARPPRITA